MSKSNGHLSTFSLLSYLSLLSSFKLESSAVERRSVDVDHDLQDRRPPTLEMNQLDFSYIIIFV